MRLHHCLSFILILLGLGLMGVGCRRSTDVPVSGSPQAATTTIDVAGLPLERGCSPLPDFVRSTSSHDLSLQELENATLTPSDSSKTIHLKNGRYFYQRMDPRMNFPVEALDLMFQGPIVWGDVNQDGKEDAVVGFTEWTGGSGHFKSIALFLNKNGKPVFAGTGNLGDRAYLRAIHIEPFKLTANTCSLWEDEDTRIFDLKDGRLIYRKQQ